MGLKGRVFTFYRFCVIPALFIAGVTVCLSWYRTPDELVSKAAMDDRTLDYFLEKGQIQDRDAVAVKWYHAANSKSKIKEALQSPVHMIEADVLLRGHHPIEPIMAHPPQNDSDVSLEEWLKEVVMSKKGIKLDFKSLQAVAPSMTVLERIRPQLQGPVWINADILPGPGGQAVPLDPLDFLNAVSASVQGEVLSLGWTTGWTLNAENQGYTWEMVQQMHDICKNITHPVTFPVRAALLPSSFPQMNWLLEQSSRYSLTVWTGLHDTLVMEDLLPYRQNISKSRVYYDLSESQIVRLMALPDKSH
ncbi:protein FAM151B [Denticeps clupeoides]|uniref:Menorin-like domain-containing protein n=1 Tax=Denticeps clupeoides TaxID=299321 RepID=A0AAY4CP03_9TELE|nr:protein FAM151B [Denticeps clupeoides]